MEGPVVTEGVDQSIEMGVLYRACSAFVKQKFQCLRREGGGRGEGGGGGGWETEVADRVEHDIITISHFLHERNHIAWERGYINALHIFAPHTPSFAGASSSIKTKRKE